MYCRQPTPNLRNPSLEPLVVWSLVGSAQMALVLMCGSRVRRVARRLDLVDCFFSWLNYKAISWKVTRIPAPVRFPNLFQNGTRWTGRRTKAGCGAMEQKSDIHSGGRRCNLGRTKMYGKSLGFQLLYVFQISFRTGHGGQDVVRRLDAVRSNKRAIYILTDEDVI
jgi:hypothetical protein